MVSADDGRLTVGLLTPHAAPGAEIEIPDLSQGQVLVTVARIGLSENATRTGSAGPPTTQAVRALAQPAAVDAAARCFRGGNVDVVAHVSTTTGYVLGPQAEAALVERLAARCAVPVVSSARAAADALHACGARRVVLVHPPWFADALDPMGVDYFHNEGFDATVLRATGLPREPDGVHTEGIVDWVSRHLGDGDDAVFMAGNGFRAARAVVELERRTGRLVLQANQVLLWSVIAATHAPLTIEGCGKLFRTPPTQTV